MSPSHWIPSTLPPGASDGATEGGISIASPASTLPQQRQQPQSPATYAYLSSLSFCVPIQPDLSRDPEISSSPNRAAPVQDQVSDGGGSGGLARQRPPSNPRRSNAGQSLLQQQQQQSQHHHLHHHHHQPPHAKLVKHKRRYCGVPGCNSIVKSQGVCQRHGAKPRKCRVETCPKQAQGNFGGMCKVHYKAQSRSGAAAVIGAASTGGQGPAASSASSASDDRGRDVRISSNGALHSGLETRSTERLPDPHASSSSAPSPPAIPSVYDNVLPASLAWRMGGPKRRGADDDCSTSGVLPLFEYLTRNGANLSGGWHRRLERQARGYPPLSAAGDGTTGPPAPVEWDDWERELIWTELLVLMGAAADDQPAAAMDLLAHAWGCRPGFHTEFMSLWIGERRTVAPMDRRAERHGDVHDEGEQEASISEGGDDRADADDNVGGDGDDAADYIDDDDEEAAMALSVGGATPVIGADAWDDACYTAHSYNEALASDLLLEHLSGSSPQHTPTAIMDGILRMMDRHGEDNGGEDDDDEDRVTDDASSSSSREDAHLVQVGNE
jgi:hypothetical protein